jgi:hypothetical protein
MRKAWTQWELAAVIEFRGEFIFHPDVGPTL